MRQKLNSNLSSKYSSFIIPKYIWSQAENLWAYAASVRGKWPLVPGTTTRFRSVCLGVRHSSNFRIVA